MDWQVDMQEVPGSMYTDVYIYHKMGDQYQVYRGPDKMETINRGETIEPSLRLDTEMLVALATTLEKKGVAPRKEYTEGKLEATQSHLKDLRSLLKLK